MPEALSLRLIDDLLRTKEPLQIPFTEKKTNIMNIKRFSDLLTYSLNLISLFVLNHITCKRENATHFYFRTVFKVNSLFSFGVVVVRDGIKDYGE